MKKHTLAFIDVETTGFFPETHEIIEIGCVLVDQDWSTGKLVLKEKESFEIKVKPMHIETADAQALRVNRYDPSAWLFAHEPKQALTLLAEKTKECIMVAHNVSFDANFLQKAFTEYKVENTMHYLRLDTISIAFAKLHKEDAVDKFSLGSLCKHFGIVNERAHTALADAQATFELYKKLMSL